MNDNSMFSVTVYIYRDGLKITSIKRTGELTDKVIPFNQMMYRQVKKLVKSYGGKHTNFSVHFYPVLKLEDFH